MCRGKFFITNPEVLIGNLSFSHIREIMTIDDAFERFFYETECIKCNWSSNTLLLLLSGIKKLKNICKISGFR